MLVFEKPAHCWDCVRAALCDQVRKIQIIQWVKLQQKLDAAVAEAFLDGSDSRSDRCAAILGVFLYTDAFEGKDFMSDTELQDKA